MNNVLYDTAGRRITAVLDFDWSCVTHPAEEFLSGLWDVGGGVHERVGKLQPMVLSGDFGAGPDADSSVDEAGAWAVVRMWSDETLHQAQHDCWHQKHTGDHGAGEHDLPLRAVQRAHIEASRGCRG
jgi:hypothetical protein